MNQTTSVMQSIHIPELTRNTRRKGYVYEAHSEDGVAYATFSAPDDMGDSISLRAVAPWVPMHPGGLRSEGAR